MSLLTQIILFSIAFIIFHIYLIIMNVIYGTPFSISNTYYQFNSNWKVLFTLFCWGYSIPCMILCLDMFGTPYMFFCGGAISFVGAAAAFREDYLTSQVHTIAATIAVIFSQVSLLVDFHQYWISLVTMTIFITLYLFHKYSEWLSNIYMYIAEILVVESLFLSIMLKLIRV